MDVTSHLEALRRAHAGVETAAFVDFRSGTVLCSSAAIAPPQERLDALCTSAANLLAGPAGDAQRAVTLTPKEALLVQRAAPDASEALCLICAPDADINGVDAALRQTANAIAGPGA